ncbi:hypothetical protein J7E24_05825 [Hymenobacter sp. ISL-91]|uniref:hypothetical protein n=1 Tax=Hymenobacter sp. ISL-91 TaxID=2819151 RepID=UPI001BE96779|nr:hypothetical protein [Hymenobacter sp. ISL-91]MBT2557294.1 hypothetical protein [Hymenobacter sp. ISL-91]
MFTQSRTYISAIGILGIALVSCDKKPEVVPSAEPATASFTRSLNFPLLPLRRDTTYTEQDVKIKVDNIHTFTNTPALMISLLASHDTVRIIIPNSSYANSWANSYSFISGSCITCVIQANHEYSPDYLIDNRRVQANFIWNSGELTNIKYNNKYKLLSADFQYNKEGSIDLYKTSSFQLQVRGSFNNVSIE